MSEEDKLLELAEKATPGPWYHVNPGMVLPKTRTVHGPVPAQRVDYVSTWPGLGTPDGHRVVIHRDGTERAPRSDDMAFIAAANPETIRALVEGKRELEAVLSEALEGRRQLALHDGCDWPPSGGWPEKAIAALTKNGVSA